MSRGPHQLWPSTKACGEREGERIQGLIYLLKEFACKVQTLGDAMGERRTDGQAAGLILLGSMQLRHPKVQRKVESFQEERGRAPSRKGWKPVLGHL